MKLANYVRTCAALCAHKLTQRTGQGTAEYAILVAVLVIAAIAIISTVGGQVTELWNTIKDGLDSVV